MLLLVTSVVTSLVTTRGDRFASGSIVDIIVNALRYESSTPGAIASDLYRPQVWDDNY